MTGLGRRAGHQASIIAGRFWETAPMPKKSAGKRSAKTTLRLPDLDHSKTSVLQSLGSVASKRTYGFAINDFIAWYCSARPLTAQTCFH
jgi:hypothetical protein